MAFRLAYALNRAIHTIALTRQRSCPRPRSYVARRTAEGKTPREIRRSLKRYFARELYRALTTTMISLDNTEASGLMIEWLDNEISRRIDFMPPFRSPSDPDPGEWSVTREDRQDGILLVVHGDMDVPAEGQLLAAAHGASRELSGRPLVPALSRLRCAGSGAVSDLLMIDHDVRTRGARRGCPG